MRREGAPAELVPARCWFIALASGLASFLDAATVISVSVSLAIWRSHFDLSNWQLGLLSGGLALSVAAGAIVGGWLGDRLGRARVFAVDLVVFLVGLVLMISASNAALLIAGVMIAGLAAGADMPTSLAVISDAVPTAVRGRFIALTQTLWIAGILDGLAVGFLVSRMGYVGTQILFGHLIVLVIITLAARLVIHHRWEIRTRTGPTPSTSIVRGLLTTGSLRLVLATAAFFALWNVASSCLGSYGPYFLVTNGDRAVPTQATGLALGTFPVALLVSLAFVKLADTVWRERLFVVAAVVQVAGFAVGAVSGGVVVSAMIILMVCYSLSNVFAGEAAYKVWSQLLLDADTRAAAMGLTYGAARAVAALAVFFVPFVLSPAPKSCRGRVTLPDRSASGIVGLGIAHHQHRQRQQQLVTSGSLERSV